MPDEATKSPQKLAAEKREAELRAQIEAETREKVERELRAQIETETAERMRSEAILNDKDVPGASGALALDPDAPDGTLFVHFLDDGFTVAGSTFRRGEEIMVKPGSHEFELQQVDGQSILAMSRDEQIAKYGKQWFAPGPWPYEELDFNDPSLTEAERAALRKVAARRAEVLNQLAKRRPSLLTH